MAGGVCYWQGGGYWQGGIGRAWQGWGAFGKRGGGYYWQGGGVLLARGWGYYSLLYTHDPWSLSPLHEPGYTCELIGQSCVDYNKMVYQLVLLADPKFNCGGGMDYMIGKGCSH